MEPQILISGTGRPYQDGDLLDLSVPLAFAVPNVMSAGDCQALIAMLEGEGFDAAPITTAYGPVLRPEVRNNQRLIFDHEQLAARLYAKVARSLPRVRGSRPLAANERFRAYKYQPGERFAPHLDGRYRRNADERSELTFMIFLNEGFEGGTTRFLDHELEVVPKTGTALLFQHAILHEGCPVTSGTKYVLRSDIMYFTGGSDRG